MEHAADKQIKMYHTVMTDFSQCTEEFLFISDIQNDRIQFLGDYEKDYALNDGKKEFISAEDVMGVIYSGDREMVMAEVARIIEGKQDSHNMNYRWVKRNGEIVWINCSGKVIRMQEGVPAFFVGRVSEKALSHLYDPLTGLWNKEKLIADLKEQKDMGRRYLMLFDIDGLTAINLTHGRKYGDALLREIAGKIEKTAGVSAVYHIDKKNFIAVIDADEDWIVKAVFKQISEKMEDKCTFTASAVPIDNKLFLDPTQMIDAVYITLVRAKQMSKNRLEMFTEEEIGQKVRERYLMEELKESVRNQFSGFSVEYQPQLYTGTYELYGTESLLRYESSSRGKIFPNEFIPILEQTRLIEPVGLWVLEQTLIQYKQWSRKRPNLHMSVNFSVVQFTDWYIAEKVISLFEKWDVPGEVVSIEITETFKLHESEQIRKTIRSLKAYGIQISIDDYGTGYSNIGYLKQLDIDEIKIDRYFVRGIKRDSYNYNLINHILEFARANNIHVCCEGMETVEELSVMEGIKPNTLQGFLFDRPNTAAAIEKTYIDNTAEEFQKRTSFIANIKQEVHDLGFMRFDIQSILLDNEIGLWNICMDARSGHCEMYVGEAMEGVLGTGGMAMTPEECYEYWHSRIHEEYLDRVHDIVKRMTESGKRLQVEYPWKHPKFGYVTVRCSGRRISDAGNKVVLSGYHIILDEIS